MSEQKLRDYLNRVTIDLQRTKRQLAEARAAAQEPIAVVSMACRFPGGVRTPEHLWDLVAAGRDAVTPVPGDRGWDVAQLSAGNVPCQGAFLDGAADFDPGFFAVSPHEATAMDPQQRLLLTTAWEAIERGGIDPAALRGSATGVYAAAVDQGYSQLSGSAPGMVRSFVTTGNSMSVLSGRVSYALGLEGPALTVDTACSSSLVALHLAARALRAGECTLALAGGVTVMALPLVFSEFSRQGAMSFDGRCKAFSATADGTGWGEGVGMLLLERLTDARRNGHPVLAVIRGSALNQDGASNGLTAPNGPSQQRLIRAALADAGVGPADVDAVEAHGTGTTLGDPIEADALLATYGRDRPADRPLLLGSLKSNIGHTQAAAGVAGVIKTVLALRHGVLPRTLHVTEPTGHADWSAGAVELLTENRPWPRTGRARLAGVSAFGMSGTNAHLILEQAPDPEPVDPAPVPPRPPVAGYVLAGRTEDARRAQALRLTARLAADPGADLAGIGRSLATTRTAFEHRAVVIAADRDELLAGLDALGRGVAAPTVTTGTAEPDTGRTVMVFPGQGAQWEGMARDLLTESPVFAAAIAECEQALSAVVDWSLTGVLRGAPDAPSLDRVDVVQPALFATMVSLAALWRSWGVEPDAVVGHSQGEIAAAVVAGALSLADGARVVALRSRAIGALAGRGGMVSLALPLAGAEAAIAAWPGRISVAAVNGPAAVVVSGDPDALTQLLARCAAQDVRARRLPVDYASHSAQVESIREEILRDLAGLTPTAARVPLFSTLTGDWLDTSGMDADYWYRNLRGTVRFDDAVRSLAQAGHHAFVEVSPHPVLAMAVQDVCEDAGLTGAVVTGTLRRDEGGLRRAVASAAALWSGGVPVAWETAFDGAPPAELPTYPFQERRYWLEPAADDGSGAEPPAADGEFWELVERGDPAPLADALDVDASPLAEVLPALGTWRRRRRAADTVDPLRYRIAWHRLTDPVAGPLTGSWLLVVPADHQEHALARWTVRALADLGAEVRTVVIGDELADSARLAAVLDAGPVPTGVLSLLALAEHAHPDHPVLPAGTALTVALVQALTALDSTAPVWSVTSAAVTTGDDDPLTAPRQAMVWGTGLVAALEQPQRWGGLVDLPPHPDDRDRDLLGAVLAGTGDLAGEDQLALRCGRLYARRLVHAPRPPRTPARPWRPRGTVLVTGGTGAVGPILARWLARGGADHLVLPGRRGTEAPGADELAADLAAHGARLSLPVCNLADREDVAQLLADLERRGTPVTAVVHAAAHIALAPLATTPLTAFAGVTAAKAAGAEHLDALLDRELDAFVLVSSIAGVWGSGDHGAYAAANAYLHALAQHRRGRGLSATTVDWGVWRTGDGRPGSDDGTDLFNLDEHGLRRMDPATAVDALQQALDDDETVIAVADVDWERFAPVFASSRPSPLLRTVPAAARALGGSGGTDEVASPAATGLRRTLAPLSAADRTRTVLDLVRTEAAAVLGHASAGDVLPGKAFQELGFASLTAVELRNRLATATGLRLPSSLVFDYPTAHALAGHLLSELLAEGSTPEEPAAAAPTASDPAGDRDPVAIVALGCRLPGGIDTPAKLWQLLVDGGDTVSELPTDRGWPGEELYHPDPDHPGTSTTRHGGFLHDAGEFDAEFFGISPREAVAMDPQQRLLLETAWEALERTGLDPAALRGSRTGVYVGVNYGDYGNAVARSGHGDGHLLTGSAASIVSGRVAYTLGLEGPAITVDTACSSSLVALHTAAQALRAGDCTLALVGGVAIMSTPGALVSFSRQRGLAPDGRCKAFADTADGMGMGEGIAVLVAERLSDARRHGHPVLAVLRGSAINQDGASNGLSAPNGPAQQRVIRAALADAGLGPVDVDAVEAHGTGTTLGDPIEAQALLATYGQGRAPDRPLLIGSLKSNLGHTQAASGVAGVLKTVLALQHAQVPPTLHVDRPTGQVDWERGSAELVRELVPWPETGRERRAGVSSFGLSGTNVHVILEQAPATDPAPDRAGHEHGPLPWVLSARTPTALAAQAARLAARLEQAGPGAADTADIAYSLAGRTPFAYRKVLVGDRAALDAGLRALAAGAEVPAADPDGRTVFVFPGQGAQWPGMTRELLDESPEFAARMAECAAALAPHVSWSLLDVLRSGEPLDRVDLVQPVLFAVMVSLAELWRAHGVVPDAVIGHSQGEIAAAVVAGGLSLADGARVVALRSRALAALAGTGGMMSVALPLTRVETLLAPYGERLSVAAVNGPSAVVVAGEPAALAALSADCDRDGVRARRIDVDYASHSARVEPVRAELLAALAPIEPGPATVPLYSTVTGDRLDTTTMTADYWYENLRRTVAFEPAVRALAARGRTTFLEISPHPVLTTAVADTVEDAGHEGTALGTLRRDEGDRRRLLLALGDAWANGLPVDWTGLLAGTGARRIELPTYAFQHRHHWALPAPGGGQDLTAAGLDATEHPLLSAATEVADTGELLLSGRISVRTHPWLADHTVSGTVLLPGAAFVELALRAADEAGCALVEELTLEAPLLLSGTEEVRIQVRVGAPDEGGGRTVDVHARRADALDPGWTRHATGSLARAAGTPAALLETWPPPGATPVAVGDLYPRFAASGYGYGPSFRGVRAAWQRGDEIFTEVELPGDDPTTPAFGIHPALLDATLHGLRIDTGPAAAVAQEDAAEPADLVRLPFSWTAVGLHASGATELRVRLARDPDGRVRIDAADGYGRPVASVGALVVRPVPPDSLRAPVAPAHDSLFRVEWTPLATGALVPPTGRWVGLGTSDRLPETYPDLAALTAALDAGTPVPDVVLAECRHPDDGPEGARAATAAALELVQGWLADARYADARLVFVTDGAVEALPGEGVHDLASAAVRGLIRSAQSEHPDRFVLVDAADPTELVTLLPTGMAAEEPQLAVRKGQLLAARLARVPAPAEPVTPPLDPNGTVLITGAGGVLGSLVARHLADHHGLRHLLLVSRRGAASPEAAALLAELGTAARFAACDVGDRAALADLLATVPAAHPLTAVVHAAGVLDDGVLEALDRQRLDTVLRPKIDGAAHLHELTRELPLAAFVLFSSAAGIVGNAGQANYAAGNTYLDALAAARRAQGLPAQALAWGLWGRRSEMTGGLEDGALRRMTTGGVAAFSDAEGLDLFDAALRTDAAALVPVRLDLGRSRPTSAAEVPALMRGLVRGVVRRSAHAAAADPGAAAALRRRLASLDPDGRLELLEDLVSGIAAEVLQHSGAGTVDPRRAFKDLGFDSLTSVELRNRLAGATGLRLPATLVFDHPTSESVAALLAERLVPGAVGVPAPPDDDHVRRLLATVSPQRLRAAGLLDALLNLGDPATDAGPPAPHPSGPDDTASIKEMNVDDLVRLAMGGDRG
ncbi:type I polyketide synthase [Streptomyces sp. NPDC005955]|uniref:type I polyketide synthase n=1 Tax=Streptomyces sp. NPDC005955 TaxID=3364738 RepID=UPI0036A1660E